MLLKRIKNYSGMGVVFIGLVAIYFYMAKHSPVKSQIEFKFTAPVKLDKITIEYFILDGDNKNEIIRRVEKFPDNAILGLIDTPNLPEGNYLVKLTLLTYNTSKSIKRICKLKGNEILKFEVLP